MLDVFPRDILDGIDVVSGRTDVTTLLEELDHNSRCIGKTKHAQMHHNSKKYRRIHETKRYYESNTAIGHHLPCNFHTKNIDMPLRRVMEYLEKTTEATEQSGITSTSKQSDHHNTSTSNISCPSNG